ncbi:hypothetical protein KIW84_051113 [Lathyrus oleraceus]|uniref:Uncharacterized protein n=1 Tax=Pisum sativum TaxID=3888 RepID=A0A9D5AFJ2_PEA|nr:hypothetical protein KIW84_051113 [Pisum sativum]
MSSRVFAREHSGNTNSGGLHLIRLVHYNWVFDEWWFIWKFNAKKSNGSTYKKGQESSEKVTQQTLKESNSRYDDQACTSENTSRGSQQSNGHTKRNTLAERNVFASGTVLSAAADTKDYAEMDPRNGENSSQVFGLGHRLLIKRFDRKV